MEEKCRACLSQDLLFNWNEFLIDEMTYADLFCRITGLNKKDFEQTLCNDCGLQIRRIHQFIKKAKESDHFLDQALDVKGVELYKHCEPEREIEKISIEILPLPVEEIQNERDNSQGDNHMDVSVEVLDESESIYPKCEIKFEMVEVDAEENEMNDESAHQDKFSKKRRKNKSIACFSCEYCEEVFRFAAAKKRHMLVHNEERILCDVCPRTFRDIFSLTKHKKTHDENRMRNYVCQQCDSKFLTSNSLKSHLEIHDDTRQKRFPCDQCEKAFFQKGALNVHRRIHTGDLVHCEICEKRFPRLVDLEIHMRSHTGEQPCICSTCGKAFKYGSSLYNHVRKAHFGYIYKCSYCSKNYKDEQALIEHKKLHKNGKYRCVLCDKEMAKKCRLKGHIKSVHNIENPEELEQLIISCKAEGKYRTMRKFTNIEYKTHIAQPTRNQSPLGI